MVSFIARQSLWLPGLFDIVQTVVPMCHSGKCRTWQIAVPCEQGEVEVSGFDKCLPYSANANNGSEIVMMTSSNGNISRVTGPLCGEFTAHLWIPLTKASDAELWCFLWSAPWINNCEAGDLRRHRAHYDVIVMVSTNSHMGTILISDKSAYHKILQSLQRRIKRAYIVLKFGRSLSNFRANRNSKYQSYICDTWRVVSLRRFMSLVPVWGSHVSVHLTVELLKWDLGNECHWHLNRNTNIVFANVRYDWCMLRWLAHKYKMQSSHCWTTMLDHSWSGTFITLRPRQNDRHFVNDILNSFLCMTIIVFWFKFHWNAFTAQWS